MWSKQKDTRGLLRKQFLDRNNTSRQENPVNSRREYFEEQYAQLSAGLFAEHGEAFPSDVFSSEAFRWAPVILCETDEWRFYASADRCAAPGV